MIRIKTTPVGENLDGVEVEWGTAEIFPQGFMRVEADGVAVFPHGDGFSMILDGDDSRVETEDGTVLWHCREMNSRW